MPHGSRRGRGGRAARPRRPGQVVASARGTGRRGLALSRRRAGPRRRPPRTGRGSERRRRRRTRSPARGTASSGRTSDRAFRVKTSPRRASITGSAPGAAKRVQRRDAGDRDVEREREAASGCEPDPDAGEAARAGADDEPVEIAGPSPPARSQRVGGGEHRTARRARRAARRRRRSATSPTSVAVSKAKASSQKHCRW